jgi:hypothetical protein
VDGGNVTDIAKVHASSLFGVDVCRVAEFPCTCKVSNVMPWEELSGDLVGASAAGGPYKSRHFTFNFHSWPSAPSLLAQMGHKPTLLLPPPMFTNFMELSPF